MGDYSSFYKYEKFEVVGDELISLGIFSIDADGTMPLVVKDDCDPQCGCPQPIYQWIQTEDTVCIEVITRTTTGTPYCSGDDLYADVTVEESIDDGDTWEVVSTTPTLVEEGGCASPEVQYRWVAIGTTCSNGNKYQNNVKQVSTDGGHTWTDVVPAEYSASTLIESDSYDCGYRTGTTSSSTYCNGDDIYVDVYSRVSRDYGTTWVTASTTPTLVEVGGCVSQNKLVLTLSDSSTVSLECDGTSAITENEISLPYSSTLVGAEIGDCVSEIGDSSFRDCSNLTSITIPDSVTSIGANAFENCGGLTSMVIPNGVISISDGAFRACTNLASVVIPSSVTSIGNLAFFYCVGLTSVTVNATTPPALGSSAFVASSCPIYVPAQSLETYKSASGWSDYASRIQAIQ